MVWLAEGPVSVDFFLTFPNVGEWHDRGRRPKKSFHQLQLQRLSNSTKHLVYLYCHSSECRAWMESIWGVCNPILTDLLLDIFVFYYFQKFWIFVGIWHQFLYGSLCYSSNLLSEDTLHITVSYSAKIKHSTNFQLRHVFTWNNPFFITPVIELWFTHTHATRLCVHFPNHVKVLHIPILFSMMVCTLTYSFHRVDVTASKHTHTFSAREIFPRVAGERWPLHAVLSPGLAFPHQCCHGKVPKGKNMTKQQQVSSTVHTCPYAMKPWTDIMYQQFHLLRVHCYQVMKIYSNNEAMPFTPTSGLETPMGPPKMAAALICLFQRDTPG